MLSAEESSTVSSDDRAAIGDIANVVLPLLGELFESPMYLAVIVAVPEPVSLYVVDDAPEVNNVEAELKVPVLLLVVHVIVPVGLKPDTVAVHVTGE